MWLTCRCWPRMRRPPAGGPLRILLLLALVFAVLLLLQGPREVDVHAKAAVVSLQLQPTAAACSKPVKSVLACETVNPGLTTRELDLQQQRRSVLECARGQPEGGYLAACLAVKNQHRDLPEWLDWHSRLGVSKFYLMDSGSDPPLDDVLAPYVADGRVVHRMLGDRPSAAEALQNATCQKYNIIIQLLAYNRCLLDYGARHQWMAFIDADEFLVLMDGTPDLPTLLRDYKQFGGLGVNWRFFGSSGHQTPQTNTLTAYTACYPLESPVHRHVKTIANMAFTTSLQHSHYPLCAPGRRLVTPNGTSIDGAFSAHVDFSRVSTNHYFTKSWQDFAEKIERGHAAGGRRQADKWNTVQARATDTCTYAADMAKAVGLA